MPAKQAPLPVAVLLPELNGVVKVNAARQKSGFDMAFKDNDIVDNQIFIEFQFPPEEEELLDTIIRHNVIIDQFEKNYNEGVRMFIMTMSTAVKDIRTRFIEWAKKKRKNDRPVLVATVASAPGIVSRENGIFRHYIRSKDESGVLATYIESINATRVGIFHVTDDYGKDAKDLLKKRLVLNLEKDDVDVIGVDDQINIQEEVENFVSESPSDEHTVAVIIGYGLMIRSTLESLKHSILFEGKILVVSTFTEEDWRPVFGDEDEHFKSRIRYVGPETKEEDTKDFHGVVFQFSYLTLDRTLKCTDRRGVEDFWNCFTNAKLSSTGQNWAEVEFTKDGDSHVSLRLLEVED